MSLAESGGMWLMRGLGKQGTAEEHTVQVFLIQVFLIQDFLIQVFLVQVFPVQVLPVQVCIVQRIHAHNNTPKPSMLRFHNQNKLKNSRTREHENTRTFETIQPLFISDIKKTGNH